MKLVLDGMEGKVEKSDSSEKYILSLVLGHGHESCRGIANVFRVLVQFIG